MGKVPIFISLDESFVESIDSTRGSTSRSAIIQGLINRGMDGRIGNEGPVNLAAGRPSTPGVNHGGNNP
jgi:hypothetical protein